MDAGNQTLDSLHLSGNIWLTDWAPQNDVLGHPSVAAFVTQGGTNSIQEAMYHGKPVIVIPLVADQPMNAAKVK